METGQTMKTPESATVIGRRFQFNPRESLTVLDVHDTNRTYKVTASAGSNRVDDWFRIVDRDLAQTGYVREFGVDCEWDHDYANKTRTKVKVLQICYKDMVLVYQIGVTDIIPESLKTFLRCRKNYLFGVGIALDLGKLEVDYDLKINCIPIDLRDEASEIFSDECYLKYGLAALTKEFLKFDLIKEKWDGSRRWGKPALKYSEILYAAEDAYASLHVYKILKTLLHENFDEPEVCILENSDLI